MAAPNHSENIILTATDSMTTGMLSELSKSLDELNPLASKIADLKKETLEREASVLKVILEKITPLVPLLSEDCEQCYRREIIILTREERVQLENSSVFSEYNLILYENGLLVRTHRYGQTMDHGQSTETLRLGWENTSEDVIMPEAAIITFGFTAISEGLIKVLGDTSSIAILKEKLEGDLAALAKALEALQSTR